MKKKKKINNKPQSIKNSKKKKLPRHRENQ